MIQTKANTVLGHNGLILGLLVAVGATLTTQATDQSGNPLDQDPTTAGNQSKSWKFKVAP